MKKVFVLIILTALLITGVSITVLSQKTPEKPVYVAQNENIPLNADTLFNLVNAEREKVGLKPLIRDARLDQSAQFKADDMVARNYFSHYDPTDEKTMNGVQKGYELTNHNTCEYVSENAATNLTKTPNKDNEDTIASWMNSEAHRNAILDSQYDITGVAISGDKIVQHFCNLK